MFRTCGDHFTIWTIQSKLVEITCNNFFLYYITLKTYIAHYKIAQKSFMYTVIGKKNIQDSDDVNFNYNTRILYTKTQTLENETIIYIYIYFNNYLFLEIDSAYFKS